VGDKKGKKFETVSDERGLKIRKKNQKNTSETIYKGIPQRTIKEDRRGVATKKRKILETEMFLVRHKFRGVSGKDVLGGR